MSIKMWKIYKKMWKKNKDLISVRKINKGLDTMN